MQSIADLTPDPKNARKHGQRNLDVIAETLQRVGFARSIVVDEAGVILAGNGVVEAAAQVGIDRLQVVDADGETVIAVRRTGLTPEQKRRLALADNRAAELADWDTEVIAQMVDEETDLRGLWSDDELAALLAEVEGGTEGLTDPDDVPELPADPITKPGDLWLLGEHRLLCGDSRDFGDVQRLFAGERANVVVTSPPYASQRAYDPSSSFKPIHPDQYVDWYRDLAANVMAVLAEDGSYFLNIKEHADEGQRSLYVKDLTIAHVREWGWRFVDEFCWHNTRNGVPGGWSNRFKNAWEPVFHFARSSEIKFRPDDVLHETDKAFDYSPSNTKAASGSGLLGKASGGYHPGMARPSNVIEAAAETGQGDHTAPFPRALPMFFIRAFSDTGDVAYDPFAGSGTTLIAAHQEQRRGYGMEISPAYCDVIVERWQQFTGQSATREAA